MGRKSPEFVKRRTKIRKLKKKNKFYKLKLEESHHTVQTSVQSDHTVTCTPSTSDSPALPCNTSNTTKAVNDTSSPQCSLLDIPVNKTITSTQHKTASNSRYSFKLNQVRSLLKDDRIDPLVMGWQVLNDIRQTEAFIKNNAETFFDSNRQKKGF